jgi:AraC-like DNA-binding protein
MEVRYTDFKTSIGAGQMYWTSCWEPHASRPSKNLMTYVVATLSLESLGSFIPFDEINWLAPFFANPPERPKPEDRKQRKDILKLGREILKLQKYKPDGWKTLQWLKIHELIILSSQNWTPPSQLGNLSEISRIMPAVQLARKCVKTPAQLEDAAAACNLSRSRFSSVFTQTMGISYAKFALRSRLSSAAALLSSSHEPIKEIAEQCGFQEISHFYHAFGKHFHCSPAEFRDSKRNLK